MRRFYLQSLARELLPCERVSGCMRMIKLFRQTVEIVHNPATMRARYRNLMHCGSVWACPVCASYITEQRRIELAHALASSGLKVALITYTLSHHTDDPLAVVLNALKAAYKRMKGGRAAAELRDHYGWLGSVRALEITHGKNGWHPHIHELALFDVLDAVKARHLETEMRDRWIDSVMGAGGFATRQNGLTVVAGAGEIAAYIDKFGRLPRESAWNITHELTKQPTKLGRAGGHTPYELLLDYGKGDKRAGALFIEYATTLKHSSQLKWSAGLRGRLGMGKAKSEIALLNEGEETGEILAILSRQDWALVLRTDARAELLKVAEAGDEALVWEFISDLE